MSSIPIRAALCGNPNVGKSTVFNALTGLHQHTGNWAGKTVGCAEGRFVEGGREIILTDLPGIYSLASHSPEEETARDHLMNEHPDVTVCVCDACTLERNLILFDQVQRITRRVILCVNLVDEAKSKGITIDADILSGKLGCPVIMTSARFGEGLAELKAAIVETAAADKSDDLSGSEREYPDTSEAARVAVKTVGDPTKRDRAVDRILCGKFTSIPAMLLLTMLVFWLTLTGSGAISTFLEGIFGTFEFWVRGILEPILPVWLASLLLDGVIATVLRVTAVMLPPMAIFFPLFTILEDLGYLPRVAFDLDRCFACCGACGKQSLTMLMGLGCNAAGVTGCRIIDSPRERLIAILTNSFMPCNGRLGLIIVGVGCLGLGAGGSLLLVVGLSVIAVGITLAVSKLLAITILRGEPSSFTLELPPYRVPRFGQVIVRSVFDRTLFVLGRALSVAAPAGIIIWLIRNTDIGGVSLYSHLVSALDPIGRLAGMDGVLMLAFLLALPAAELMLPLALASVGSGASYLGADIPMAEAFAVMGWDSRTILCMVVFMMFHFPCATTLITIHRETGSLKWAFLAALIPTIVGYGICVMLSALPI